MKRATPKLELVTRSPKNAAMAADRAVDGITEWGVTESVDAFGSLREFHLTGNRGKQVAAIQVAEELCTQDFIKRVLGLLEFLDPKGPRVV